MHQLPRGLLVYYYSKEVNGTPGSSQRNNLWGHILYMIYSLVIFSHLVLNDIDLRWYRHPYYVTSTALTISTGHLINKWNDVRLYPILKLYLIRGNAPHEDEHYKITYIVRLNRYLLYADLEEYHTKPASDRSTIKMKRWPLRWNVKCHIDQMT